MLRFPETQPKINGIEINEDHVKIGWRRLQITTEYNGQPLRRERTSYEQPIDEKQTNLTL